MQTNHQTRGGELAASFPMPEKSRGETGKVSPRTPFPATGLRSPAARPDSSSSSGTCPFTRWEPQSVLLCLNTTLVCDRFAECLGFHSSVDLMGKINAACHQFGKR